MNSALINVMTAAAIKAGKGLLRDFGEVDHLQVSKKGPANFVTKSDTRTEKLLVKELSAARPNFGFLLEEGGEIQGEDTSHRWIIDPVDGTSNFIHAIPYFCISIGLEKKIGDKSEIIAGIIYDPIHNEMFTTEKGKGAFLGNRKLVVSRRDKLEDAMLISGGARFANEEERKVAFNQFDTLAKSHTIQRSLGATALDLAYIAAGRLDGGWFYTIKPWDLAAGMLLVREAGGMLSEISGKSADCYAKNLLAANPYLHPTLQKLLAQ